MKSNEQKLIDSAFEMVLIASSDKKFIKRPTVEEYSHFVRLKEYNV